MTGPTGPTGATGATGPSGAGQPGLVKLSFNAGELLIHAGGSTPGEGSYNTVGYISFSETREEEAFLNETIPTDRQSTSSIVVEIVFMNDQAQTGDKVCRWGVEYVTIDAAEDYDSKSPTTVETNVSLSTGASAREVYAARLTLTYNDSNNPLSKEYIWLRVYRESQDVGDTMSGDALLTHVHFEYTADKLGS